MNNADKIESIIVALNANKVPDELRIWLSKGFQEYREFDGHVTLDKILGLRGHGQNSIQYEFKQKRRNAIIRELAEFYAPGCSVYNQAVVLIKTIDKFEISRVKRLKRYPDLVRLLPYGQKKIFELFCLDIKIPRSKTGIMNIIKK